MKSDRRKKIMGYLAHVLNDEDRSKAKIIAKTRLGSQSVYDELPSMERQGYIEAKKSEKKSRRGDTVLHYHLTPLGWFRVCLDDPKLLKTVKATYGNFRSNVLGSTEQTFGELLEMLQEIVSRKSGPENCQLNLNVRTDAKGHVYRIRFVVGSPTPTATPTIANALEWCPKSQITL